MYAQMQIHIRGLVPCMTKNGQTANPLNAHAKSVAEIASIRKKSDADRVELARREWLAALYLTEDGKPGWAGECIEAMLRTAARRTRQGKSVEAGLFVEGVVPLIYKGPKDPEKLWELEEFRDIRNVVVGGKTVPRCRPIFRAWELSFTVHFDPEVINPADLRAWVEYAGRYVGLSDGRPKYGRFELVSAEVIKSAA